MVVVLRHCHLSLQGEIERGDSQATESAAYDNYSKKSIEREKTVQSIRRLPRFSQSVGGQREHRTARTQKQQKIEKKLVSTAERRTILQEYSQQLEKQYPRFSQSAGINIRIRTVQKEDHHKSVLNYNRTSQTDVKTDCNGESTQKRDYHARHQNYNETPQTGTRMNYQGAHYKLVQRRIVIKYTTN